MNKEHGLYKYVYDGQIIYIGKTNSSIQSRINSHKKEDRFNKYIGEKLVIYYCILPNSTEVDMMERALINKYKPLLNIADNNPSMSNLIKIEEPEWVIYDEDNHKSCKANTLPDIPQDYIDNPVYLYECNKKKNEIECVYTYAPHGFAKKKGYKPVPLEKLNHYKNYYYSINISYIHYDEVSDYKPQDIFEKLKQICHNILVKGCNFGLNEYRTNDSIEELIHNSVIEINFYNGWSYYVINANNPRNFTPSSNIDFLLTYIILEDLKFEDALRLYFKISRNMVKKSEVEHILSIYDNSISRLDIVRTLIGNEFYEEKVKRELNEFEKKYMECIKKAYDVAQKTDFLVIAKDKLYGLNYEPLQISLQVRAIPMSPASVEEVIKYNNTNNAYCTSFILYGEDCNNLYRDLANKCRYIDANTKTLKDDCGKTFKIKNFRIYKKESAQDILIKVLENNIHKQLFHKCRFNE